MSDIDLVIKIPEEVYRAYKMDSSLSLLNANQKSIAESYLINGLINGTPLPKEYGDLIDVSELLTISDIRADGSEFTYVPYSAIDNAEIIIKTNKT